MARNAQRTADSAPRDTNSAAATVPTAAPVSGTATATAEYSVHGLVAITDGPDYCLCGSTWPCSRRPGQDAQP